MRAARTWQNVRIRITRGIMSQVIKRITDLVGAGALDDAQRELDAASPETIDATARQICRGQILEREGAWSDAAAVYQGILDNDPDDVEAAFRLAFLADLRGDDQVAIEHYENITAEVPVHVNAMLNLAILYEDHGRFECALDAVERVLVEYPNHKRAQRFHKDMLASVDMYYDEDSERSLEKRNEILETPISDFELSVRSRNCLKQMDIHTLGDLLRTTASELLSYKNFGETSLHEIEAMLSQKGLRIGQLLEEREPDVSRLAVPSGLDPAKAGMLNRSVAELELSVRARKCLMRLGVSTIGELVNRSEAEMLSIKNFGMTSLAEIKRRLGELGMTLKGG